MENFSIKQSDWLPKPRPGEETVRMSLEDARQFAAAATANAIDEGVEEIVMQLEQTSRAELAKAAKAIGSDECLDDFEEELQATLRTIRETARLAIEKALIEEL